PLLAWGDKGDQPGGFGAYQFSTLKQTLGPIGVAVDKSDRVWVSSLNDRVQAFTPEGKFLFGISTPGHEPGQLARPHGMAFDSRGHLYVADAGNQRVQKFEVPAAPGGDEEQQQLARQRCPKPRRLALVFSFGYAGDLMPKEDARFGEL